MRIRISRLARGKKTELPRTIPDPKHWTMKAQLPASQQCGERASAPRQFPSLDKEDPVRLVNEFNRALRSKPMFATHGRGDGHLAFARDFHAKRVNRGATGSQRPTCAVANPPAHPILPVGAVGPALRGHEAADSQNLQEIASAPTDYEVLLRQLTGCLDVLRGHDSLADARLRGLKMKEELLKQAGGAMNADQVGKLLNLTRQAVDKRRKARRLVAIEFGKRGYLYPAFQFDEQWVVPVEQVLERMDPRIEDWSLLAFFVNGNAYLKGASPVEVMRQGEVEEVLRAAQACGSQGAA